MYREDIRCKAMVSFGIAQSWLLPFVLSFRMSKLQSSDLVYGHGHYPISCVLNKTSSTNEGAFNPCFLNNFWLVGEFLFLDSSHYRGRQCGIGRCPWWMASWWWSWSPRPTTRAGRCRHVTADWRFVVLGPMRMCEPSLSRTRTWNRWFPSAEAGVHFWCSFSEAL